MWMTHALCSHHTSWMTSEPPQQCGTKHPIHCGDWGHGKLPFLDVLLEHEVDGSIATTVYSHTDKYLDFTSHHPLAYKLEVRTLHTRAETISSTVPHTMRRSNTSGKASPTMITQRLLWRKAQSLSAQPQPTATDEPCPCGDAPVCARYLWGSQEDSGTCRHEGCLPTKQHTQTVTGAA